MSKVEDNKNQIALVGELDGVVISKELIQTEDFSKKYEYLLGLIDYLDNIKKSVNEEIKNIIKDDYLESGEPSVKTTGYRFTYTPETTRESLDTKKLKEEEPELYKKYVKISKVSESIKAVKVKEPSKKDTAIPVEVVSESK